MYSQTGSLNISYSPVTVSRTERESSSDLPLVVSQTNSHLVNLKCEGYIPGNLDFIFNSHNLLIVIDQWIDKTDI